MELKEAVKVLRKELCLTQMEMAQALNLSYATINRWEAGRTIPKTSTIHSLLMFAEQRDASEQCRKYLSEALQGHKKVLNLPDSDLYAVERESICQLVDESYNAIYVVDMETDEILYANQKARLFFGKKFKANSGQKCYELLNHRSDPCPNCPKAQLDATGFNDAHILLQSKNRNIHVRGKLINWNGRLAHVQYIMDKDDSGHLI